MEDLIVKGDLDTLLLKYQNDEFIITSSMVKIALKNKQYHIADFLLKSGVYCLVKNLDEHPVEIKNIIINNNSNYDLKVDNEEYLEKLLNKTVKYTAISRRFNDALDITLYHKWYNEVFMINPDKYINNSYNRKTIGKEFDLPKNIAKYILTDGIIIPQFDIYKGVDIFGKPIQPETIVSGRIEWKFDQTIECIRNNIPIENYIDLIDELDMCKIIKFNCYFIDIVIRHSLPPIMVSKEENYGSAGIDVNIRNVQTYKNTRPPFNFVFDHHVKIPPHRGEYYGIFIRIRLPNSYPSEIIDYIVNYKIPL